jgi:alkanesulfonate monooxygenase
VKQLWIRSAADRGERLLAAHDPLGHIPPLDHQGKYFRLEGGISYPPPVQRPHPPIYFGGSSEAAKKTAAAIADVYLMWAEPVEWIREQIDEVERRRREWFEATGEDRFIRYGLRAQVVIRDTEEEAWTAARRIVSRIDPALKQSREGQRFYISAGQQRQNELKKLSEANDYVIGPNFWAGLAQVRGGGAMAFVGTPEQVADRLLEYVGIGVTSFILSGYPNLEEASISGEALLPVFRRKWLERKRREDASNAAIAASAHDTAHP